MPTQIENYINVEYKEIIKETEKAYCVKFGELKPKWFPKSKAVLKGGNIISVADWLLANHNQAGELMDFILIGGDGK